LGAQGIIGAGPLGPVSIPKRSPEKAGILKGFLGAQVSNTFWMNRLGNDRDIGLPSIATLRTPSNFGDAITG
jgi:hypothetical protein